MNQGKVNIYIYRNDKWRDESDRYETSGSGWQEQSCTVKYRTTSFLSSMAWKCVRTLMPWLLGDVHGVLKWHSKAGIIQALEAICGPVWTRCCWGSCFSFSATLWYSRYGSLGTPANTVHTLMPVECFGRGREWQLFSRFSFQPLNLALPAGTKNSLSENSSLYNYSCIVARSPLTFSSNYFILFCWPVSL